LCPLKKEKAMKNRFELSGGIALAVMVSFSVISAQERQPAPERIMIDKIEHERMIQEHPHPPMPHGGDFIFLATEMAFDGKLVKGAPYSAQAVTESTHTLSDGNRIVNKSTAAVYRDSEGRTRREQTLRAIGALANAGESPQTIFISDPVAGTSYTLDPSIRIARKMPPMRFKIRSKTPAPEDKSGATLDALSSDQIEIERSVIAGTMAHEPVFTWGWRNHQASTESLGRQTIEGIEAEGTRSTVKIPAGEIGNERPIKIVNERWYSPELQTVVMTRHIDPRFGENSYRLANIDRTDPARSLFEVPAGYRIEEGPGPGHKVRLRKPAGEQ